MGQIFVYLLTGGGAIASLIRPIYGLCAYIILAVVRPDIVWKWSVEPGNYSRILAIALLIGWALHGFGGLRLGRAWFPAAAISAFWGWSLASSMSAQFQIEPWIFMDNLTKIVVPVLVGLTLINTKKDLMIIAWTLGLSSAFLAIHENENYVQWGVGVGDNQTAHTMAAMCGFLFFLGFGTKTWWLRFLMIGAALAAAHAVMFHMSRGGMLGVAVAVVLIILMVPKTPLFYGTMVLIALAGMRLAGPQVIDEFFTTFADAASRDESAIGRTVFWKAMARATADYPVFGVGPHNWPTVSFAYGIPGREGHGAWQQLAAETGIPGITFLMLFYGTLIVRLFPWAMGFCRPEYEELRPVAQMYVVTLCSWIICQIFGSFYLVEFPYYVAMMGAGLLKVSATVTPAPEDEAWEDEWIDDEQDQAAAAAGVYR